MDLTSFAIERMFYGMTTITAPERQAAAIDRIIADLAAATDQLIFAVRRETAGDGGPGLPVAGEVLRVTSRLTAAAVTALSSVTHRGVIADEGLTIGSWLRSFAGCTYADERMLDNAAGRLADMPTLSRWFADGAVSWATVRGVVYAVRNLTKAQRRWVDATLAQDQERVGRLGPDELVEAVERLAHQARPDLHRDREQRSFEHEFLRLQLGLDGSSCGTFALNAEDTQTLINALRNVHPDTGTTDPSGDAQVSDADEHPGEHSHQHAHDHGFEPPADTDVKGDEDEVEDDGLGWRDLWRERRECTNVRALMALCRQRLQLAGGDAPAAGKPTMLIIADLDALRDPDGVGSATAQLLIESTRGPVELTRSAAQRLACEASWRVIFTDGAEVLGSTATHPGVSASLRATLIARDGGCRFPGCRQPAAVCVNHHSIPVSRGGRTELENTALLCEAHHHAVHDGGWADTLHPDGTMMFTRLGTTLTSLPRSERSFRPATRPPGGRPTRPRTRSEPEPHPTAPPGLPPEPDDLPF
jgi:hypothetical protein